MTEEGAITKLTQEQQSYVLYWPTIAKIPIIPCDSRNKSFSYPWKDVDFTSEDWNRNLAAGLYDNGIALRLGPTLQPGVYSFALDFDGIDAVMEFFGSWENVISMAKKTRIEWHQDKGRLHIVFFAEKNVTKKRTDIKKHRLELRTDELLIVSPSIHGDGNAWSVLGTEEIAVLNDADLEKLEEKIDSLSSKDRLVDDDHLRPYVIELEAPTTDKTRRSTRCNQDTWLLVFLSI